MTEPIRVAIVGYGKLGAALALGLAHSPDVALTGIVRRTVREETITLGGRPVRVSADLGTLLDQTATQVVVEASLPGAALAHCLDALARRTGLVIATSGLGDAAVDEIRRECERQGAGAVLAPNLSVGSVVLTHLSAVAGRFFDYVDVIEMHREGKLDAPSGTALHTARVMTQVRGRNFERAPTERFTLDGVRGGATGGAGIHSIRLPGLVAHQQVIFGGLGQTLTIRHDTVSNESYVPGALMAIKHAVASKGLTVGLASLLGLE